MGRSLIIAEAGVNHNGSLDIAKKMVEAAHRCGADVIKFQTYEVDSLVSAEAPMAEYQKKNTGRDESQRAMLEKLALTREEFSELADFCGKTGIEFLSTPFDISSVYFLNPMQRFWKIPSGEITNYPYLREIGKTGKPVILSTGMSTLGEIHEALDVLKSAGTGSVTLLHCTTEYPTPPEHVNLLAMKTLEEEFGLPVGYSDHTQGIEVDLAAAAMGAVVIEKHFTLDRTMEGPDHKASLEPDELAAMVRGIRKVERALGSGRKEPGEEEMQNRVAARKSIVAARNIAEGEIFSEENITAKRPGSGISPMRWNDVLGRKAKRAFQKDEMIEL